MESYALTRSAFHWLGAQLIPGSSVFGLHSGSLAAFRASLPFSSFFQKEKKG
jgi:hypothetical protein